jgi:hypothetical protein
MDPRSCAMRRVASVVIAIALISACFYPNLSGQEVFLFDRGQNVAPVFEGWEHNPDGSFNMVFGYFNRNVEEVADIPVGPDNSVEPGGPDQGQPTHLLTRRHKFVFRVRVPSDFGKNEVIWTLTINGKTERAYGTLRSEFGLSNNEIQMNWGAMPNAAVRGEDARNQPPIIKLEGSDRRTVKVGQPLTLTAFISDDELLKPRAGQIVSSEGTPMLPRFLRAGWYVYRGAQKVRFDPEQRHPEANRAGPLPPPIHTGTTIKTTATFSEPGTVVLQLMAHDGGLATTQSVTVTVLPG